MFISAFYIDLFIPGVRNLKERRQVVLSIKDKLKKKNNFSVVEIPHKERLDAVKLGIAYIAASYEAALISKETVRNILDGSPVEVISFNQEIFELER
ncbi:MAG: DUF503 domain-containing protein [Actinobacteria bacterium]|nr:DUF503 domain-containing protein [Actinomycetota bacterium]